MTKTQSNAAFSRLITSTNVIAIPAIPKRILITENVSMWYGPVKEQLEELVHLPPGWDGYSAVPVSFVNANFALRMLEKTCGLESMPPQIVPGTAGDLQIEWHTMDGDIELHVRAPNDVHAWRAMVGGDSQGEELELTTDFSVIAQWVKEIMEPLISAEATAAR